MRQNALENVVCWLRLLYVNAYVNDYFSHTASEFEPQSDCSSRSSLILVNTDFISKGQANDTQQAIFSTQLLIDLVQVHFIQYGTARNRLFFQRIILPYLAYVIYYCLA